MAVGSASKIFGKEVNGSRTDNRIHGEVRNGYHSNRRYQHGKSSFEGAGNDDGPVAGGSHRVCGVPPGAEGIMSMQTATGSVLPSLGIFQKMLDKLAKKGYH